MSRIINWGILGPGKIANRFASSFINISTGKLRAVASRDSEKAKVFAKQYSIPVSYDSYEALINDPEIDVIYIATPHPFHAEQTLLCLNAKKAVLCEKPLTLNHTLASRLVTAARQNDTFLMEAMWTRFFPTTIKTLELINKGSIGDVKYLRADFGFKAPYNEASRLFDLSLGGGAMLDVGIYPLFLALLILGKPTEIKSFAHLSATGADEITNALLYYKHGAIANILSAIVTDTPKNAEIIGTEGTITIHTPWHKASVVTLQKNSGDEERFALPYSGTGFEFQIEEVNHCLQNNKKESDLMPLNFSLMMTEVSDAIRAQCGIKYIED
jgi:predicted dehydrogenase